MSQAYIKAISYYLPEDVLSNKELNDLFPEWSADKISSKTGIYNRHIAAHDQTSGDMGVKAAQRLFSEHNINGEDIDFVILCTQSPDYFLPTTACIIQDRLNLNKNIGAIDLTMGCSGYVYGLSIAKGLIVSDSAKNVLLITSETYTKYINEKDKNNRTIFGDGASASLITSNGNNVIGSIGNFAFGTDGAGSEYLMVRNGASRFPLKDGVDIISDDGAFERNDNNLYMNGKEIFNFTATQVPILVQETLKRSDLSFDQIDLFVYHQANEYMMNFIRRKMSIPEDKFYVYLKDVGNTVSSTIPIALYHAIKEDRVEGNVLLAGFGVGLSMASTVIKIER